MICTVLCDKLHGSVSSGCHLCIAGDNDRLRRDLATRDRELEEARAAFDDAARDCVELQAERDQARAALAEKEREWRNLIELRDAQIATGTAALAAAQEEAQGLREMLDQVRDTLRRCDSVRCSWALESIERALAARQQQPDGKPDPGKADGER